MSNRALRVSGKEVAAALQRGGWVLIHTKGSHAQLKQPDRPGKVTIPIHGTIILLPKTLKSILAQAGMTEDQLRELL